MTEHPTSYGQQRLWLIDQMEQGSTAYNILVPVRLRGRLDTEALAAGLSGVVARHEVLRTTYRADGDRTIQVVGPPEPVTPAYADLAGLGPAEREQALSDAFVTEETTPFDLAAGPVVRARLLRLAPDDHVLLICVHHIAVDAESVPLLYDELARGYGARVAGTTPDLPPLPAQYGDYAAAQRDRMRGEERDRLLAYWRTQLAGLAPLDLPVDHLPGAAGEDTSAQGGYLQQPLPTDLTAALERMAEAEGVSTFAAFQAGLAVLLSRYCGQDDVAVGTVAADRNRPELTRLIGFFANTLVLRTDVSGEPTFREVLRRAGRAAAGAHEHAELPFDVVVGELAPSRDAGRNPFFRVYLNVDGGAAELPPFAGLDAEAMPPDFSTARFDLGFVMRTGTATPTVDCIYRRDLFEQATVERMLTHLVSLLGAALAAPDRPVTELPMLTDDELRTTLVAWNDTARPFPEHACLHELVEQAADRTPDGVAVVCGDESVTYQELDERANRLAHRLRAGGVRPESLVGVCLRASVRRAVAVLGVLKAGGGFLPLDPDYPPERLSYMVSDAGCWGVLTEEALAGRFGDDAGHLVRLDAAETRAGGDWDLAAELCRRLEAPVDPQNLAYVIYTSGSTGAPKGIALRHRGAVNNFTDFNARFGVGPGDALLGVSSPSFDMSVYDLLGTLAAGGTLVLPPPEHAKEPARWAELIAEHRVTVWHSAPALLELLLDHLGGTGGRAPSIRLALLGGDWIPVSMPDRLRSAAPDVRVIALGGATEASMDSILFEVGEVDPGWRSIPYGRPMANQRAYILDRHDQPQPVGVPGELHLAGAGLARGYLRRAELTADRFVDRTLPDGRRERLYRTGDLARYGPDGTIELLGRMDFQVKIHGLRIELGEIEAALRAHPSVGDAAVVARGERGHTTLAGFVRPADGASIDDGALRTALSERLPTHMVPGLLVPVERIPTTPNGKVDRRALAEWEAEPDDSGTAPRDPLEQRIATVWEEVLGVGGLGIDDNFFERGGDSFAAVRAMLALGSPLPVVELFQAGTVRALAERLRAAGDGPRRLLHRLTPADRDVDVHVLCVPYGGGNAVAYRPLAEALPDRYALWVIAQPGYDPGGSPADFLPFEEVVRRCVDEVVERIDGPVVVYGHCVGTAMAVAIAGQMESRHVDLRKVYLAAALPEQDPAGALAAEGETSDGQWADYLRTLGGFDGALDWAAVEHIMAAGRNDHRGAMGFLAGAYAAPPARLRVPVHCVFGDADPATEGYPEKFAQWEVFASRLSCSDLAGAGHYFVRDRAGEVAALIQDDRHAAAAA
jgi:amino acid adenylation domain-containing protein